MYYRSARKFQNTVSLDDYIGTDKEGNKAYAAYKDAYNGNKSAIHWDMVLIQREDFGGGNIYFDDVLIRENGVFVVDELKHLNK